MDGIDHLDFDHTVICEGWLGTERCSQSAEYKFLIHELDKCTGNAHEWRVLLLCGWCASKRWMDVAASYKVLQEAWPQWVRRCASCGLLVNDVSKMARYEQLPKDE